jgi:GTP diphosphokinase / guanosine-3',5'-bis(diphosphate) 3'-diphosphatase
MPENNIELAGNTNIKTSQVDKSVDTPADFTSPEVLYNKLIETIRQYHPSSDLSDIERAYKVAKEAHEGQFRKSGEPYIIHPLCVAIILAELELDKESIIAGLLHDVVEDTVMTSEDVAREFGDEVALLVDGVTKLTQLNYQHDKIEVQAENLRKMFLAMAKDIRVIMIKLADRLHNMRTMQYQSPAKQVEKSRETMDIYAPIAHRLGISKIKVELDDLSMKYLMPDTYNDLVKQVDINRPGREAFIKSIIKEVGMHISNAGIEAEIDGRVKHFFSIYRKMVNQNKTLDQIYDIFAVRIKVDTVKDCYAALGVIHEMYKPIPGRFKDYIAMPKPNMYQSLHTTLIASNGQPFEVQIRTYEMHRIAEYGIAAHWKYKEGKTGESDKSEEAKLSWLRQILEWQRDMSDNKEFLSSIKNDLNLFSDSVYCFTPTGDVKTLPAGSNPIDFAYSIHSAVGNKMVGARVNSKLVNIDYEIKNGDRIEIITSQNSKGPSRDWLSMVKSTQARNKINQWFKQELKEDNIIKGKELISNYCKSKGIVLSEINKPEFVEKALRKYGYKDWNAVLAAVGHGALKEGQIVNKLNEEYQKTKKAEITDKQVLDSIVASESKEKEKEKKGKGGIVVKGIHDVAVRFSKCCE